MKRIFTASLAYLYIAIGPSKIALVEGRGDPLLEQGVLLLAAPELVDPNFLHTVVLLIRYGEGGALGLIINRPTGIPLEQALPNLEGVEHLSSSLFHGGPVERERLLALLRSDHPLDEAQNVFDDVYITESRTTLAQALQNRNPDKQIRVYSGYAGWAPGQLDREVRRRDWIIIDADLEAIFSENPSEIWTMLIQKREKIEVRRRPGVSLSQPRLRMTAGPQ